MSKNDENNKYFNSLFNMFERSNEVYFGKESQLAQDLLKYSKQLKDIIPADKVDYSDRAMLAKLYKCVENFNNAIQKDVNCEKVYISIIPNEEDNAFAYPLYYHSDLKENGYINMEKVAKLEDFIIVPSIGYQYKDPNGKILILGINTGCIKKSSVDEIAATIAHELGHCFQDCIFGTFKDIANEHQALEIAAFKNTVAAYIEPMSELGAATATTGAGILITIILDVFLFPFLLLSNILEPLSRAINLSIFKKIFKKEKMRTQDIMDDYDKSKSGKKFYRNSGFKSTVNTLAQISTNTRKEDAEKLVAQNKELMEDTKGDTVEEVKKKTKNSLINFFRSIYANICTRRKNTLYAISLSDYNMKKYQDMDFVKRYEFFADIFATSLGFGPDLYKTHVNNTTEAIDNILEKDLVGINKIGLFKAGYLYNKWKEFRRIMINDTHGTFLQRGQNMLTALEYEIKNNRSLTTQQKNDIQSQIDRINEADRVFLEDRKEHGFWFKTYNKFIEEGLKGSPVDTEKNILKPLEEVCKECTKDIKITIKK